MSHTTIMVHHIVQTKVICIEPDNANAITLSFLDSEAQSFGLSFFGLTDKQREQWESIKALLDDCNTTAEKEPSND